MKRLLTFLMIIFGIGFLTETSVDALVLDAPSEDSSESIVLTGIYQNTDNSFYPYLDKIIVLEPDELIPENELTHAAYCDASGKSYVLTANYNITDASLLTPGFHLIKGIPELKENMSLAEGFDGICAYPMFRKGGTDVLTATRISNPTISDYIIEQGSSNPENEISITTKNCRFAVSDTGYVQSKEADWNWEWDFSNVNVNVPGTYTITGNVTATPDYISLSKNNAPATLTVYVVETGGIVLSTPTKLLASGQLQFEWAYDSSNVSNVILEQQLEDGTWEICNTKWYYYKKASSFANANFQLRLDVIPIGDYIFRLQYDDVIGGEAVTRTTKSLHITIPENIIEIIAQTNGTTVPKDLPIGGDRDGGDSEGDDMPDYTQPAPDSDSSDNNSESSSSESTDSDTNNGEEKEHTNQTKEEGTKESVHQTDKKQQITESVTDTSTTISGKRLSYLIESGDTVLFEKKGVSVEIPSSVLKGLNLTDTDLLEVTITRSKTNKVQLLVKANGVIVDHLEGTTISYPGYNTLHVSAPGTYNMVKTKVNQANEDKEMLTHSGENNNLDETKNIDKTEISDEIDSIDEIIKDDEIESIDEIIKDDEIENSKDTATDSNIQIPKIQCSFLAAIIIIVVAVLLLFLFIWRKRSRE